MKLISYQFNEETKVGALRGDTVVDLARAYATSSQGGVFPIDMIALLSEGEAGLNRVKAAVAVAERVGTYTVPI